MIIHSGLAAFSTAALEAELLRRRKIEEEKQQEEKKRRKVMVTCYGCSGGQVWSSLDGCMVTCSRCNGTCRTEAYLAD